MEFVTFVCACVFTLGDISAQRKNPDRFKKSSAALDPNAQNAQIPKEPEKSDKPKTPVKPGVILWKSRLNIAQIFVNRSFQERFFYLLLA